jgi:rod shape determining protein RodA
MLVMAQPDLGTSLVYVIGTLALLFVGGAPWRHFAALAALGAVAIALAVVALPAAGVEVLKPYQVDRLTSFLHPSDAAGEEGYQQQQSKIAIGSGEKTGRGVEKATQTGLNFLPEHHTDFIFSVVGETYGFAGAALVLSLYALLIWRGLHILTIAKNLFGALIAGGITMMLLFQVFVNVGMTVGIMPITGVPAPLLSFGGSSMLVTFMAIGLLQSIHAQAREIGAIKGRASVFQ